MIRTMTKNPLAPSSYFYHRFIEMFLFQLKLRMMVSGKNDGHPGKMISAQPKIHMV